MLALYASSRFEQEEEEAALRGSVREVPQCVLLSTAALRRC